MLKMRLGWQNRRKKNESFKSENKIAALRDIRGDKSNLDRPVNGIANVT